MRDDDFEVLGAWLLPAANLLRSYDNVDAEALFAQAGLDVQTNQNGVYTPISKVNHLLQMAIISTGDELFPLKIAQYVEPVTFQSLGFTIAVADNVRQMLGFIVKYNRLLSNTCDLELRQEEKTVSLLVHHKVNVHGYRILSPHSSHAFISTVKSLTERLSQRTVQPLTMCFSQPLTPELKSAYEAFFECPVKDDQPHDALIFDANTADLPLPMANPKLVQINEEVLTRYLATLEHSNLTWKIKAKLLTNEPFKLVGAEQMASEFYMSLRSFQRRLSELGTSYKLITDQAREDKAKQLLSNDKVSISEIAYQLGFSSVSNFSSAFKRWTASTPNQYRRQSLAMRMVSIGETQ